MERIRFHGDEKACDILMAWRKELAKHTAARAELRRAQTPLDVAQVGFYHVLIRRLRKAGYGLNSYNSDKVAVAAALVARIRYHNGNNFFAAQMAKEKFKGTPFISKMRLKRILAAEEHEDVIRELSSAIRIMGDRANITDLADAVVNWNDWTRRDWLYRYHGNTDI
ncbi:MAG: type I-E CRISPR-associated protein Cse2/CasB [Desulfovibrionales bacterium]|nr:type I-E CRISPR-associated protein Cse2/CasB [Desulfovibrionales bacterium]